MERKCSNTVLGSQQVINMVLRICEYEGLKRRSLSLVLSNPSLIDSKQKHTQT